MERVFQFCLGTTCLLTPVLLLLLAGGVYALGTGAVKVPGIARREMHPGKDWITVPELSRKVTETLAVVISLVGALFGLIGFMLPWASVNIGAGGELLDLGSLSGTMTGIALAFQSLLVGIGLLSVEVEGAIALAFGLILVSLLLWLIPLAILVSAGIGVGLVSVPLGLLKAPFQRLARVLLIASVLSLCLTCCFFAGIQATVGGLKVGGAEELLGTSASIGVDVARGFWITVGGGILTLLGAIVANTLATGVENWAKHLATLERE